MNKERLTSILAKATVISMFFPFIGFKPHHNCMYDECFRIFYRGNLGICVQGAIDTLFCALALLWLWTTMGCVILLGKNKSTISPFVIMGLLIVLAVLGAFIHPAKWTFVIALLPSFILFIICIAIDNKDAKQ